MRRKVNRVGQNTLTVSLPATWAKQYGIKQGDELEVSENANTLLVSPKITLLSKETTIKIASKDHFLKRFLVTPYIKGYDQIRVEYPDPSLHLSIIEAMNRYMIGFEVVDTGKDFCILKNIAEGLHTEFDTNFRKYFLKVKMVVADLEEAFRNKDDPQIEHVIITDRSIDKLCCFMRRLLNKQGYTDEAKGKSLYYLVNMLETVADHCRDMAKRVKETGKFPSKNVITLLKQTRKVLEFYYDMYYKFDLEKVFEYKSLNKSMKKKILNNIDNNDPDLFFYYHIMAISEMEHNMSEELE